MAFSLVVPAVTSTFLPARSRKSRIGEPFLTMTLVPATNTMGEKATRFCRSTLLVVEPHSRSTRPLVTASMRLSDVTGSQRIVRLRLTASSIELTSALHSSTE